MKPLFLLFLMVASAGAQAIGVGVKGGAPLGDIFKASGYIGGQPFQARTQRFTIGPALEVSLPFGTAIEFDALHKRFRQSGGGVNGGVVEVMGSSWEFPFLGKYRVGSGPVRPYAEAGVSLNRLGGYMVAFKSLPAPPPVQPTASSTRAGVVVGTGVELKLPGVRVSSGLRFSHWGGNGVWEPPNTNMVDVLLGIGFYDRSR